MTEREFEEVMLALGHAVYAAQLYEETQCCTKAGRMRLSAEVDDLGLDVRERLA